MNDFYAVATAFVVTLVTWPLVMWFILSRHHRQSMTGYTKVDSFVQAIEKFTENVSSIEHRLAAHGMLLKISNKLGRLRHARENIPAGYYSITNTQTKKIGTLSKTITTTTIKSADSPKGRIAVVGDIFGPAPKAPKGVQCNNWVEYDAAYAKWIAGNRGGPCPLGPLAPSPADHVNYKTDKLHEHTGGRLSKEQEATYERIVNDQRCVEMNHKKVRDTVTRDPTYTAKMDANHARYFGLVKPGKPIKIVVHSNPSGADWIEKIAESIDWSGVTVHNGSPKTNVKVSPEEERFSDMGEYIMPPFSAADHGGVKEIPLPLAPNTVNHMYGKFGESVPPTAKYNGHCTYKLLRDYMGHVINMESISRLDDWHNTSDLKFDYVHTPRLNKSQLAALKQLENVIRKMELPNDTD